MKKYLVDLIIVIGVVLITIIVYIWTLTTQTEYKPIQDEHKFNIHKSSSSYGHIT